MNIVERVYDGEVVHLPQHLQRVGLFHALVKGFLDCIEHVCGREIRTQVQETGLEYLHLHLTPFQIQHTFYKIEEWLTLYLPNVMLRLANSIEFPRPFCIHKNSICRIMVPVELLQEDWKYHLGRLYPYDGIHRDAFENNLGNVINLWIALGPILKGNGMETFPDMWNKELPKLGFLSREGLDLGESVPFEGEPGDIWVFHSHQVHTSIWNHTNQTRVALTSRLSPLDSGMEPLVWKTIK